jgi:hypothetical protein
MSPTDVTGNRAVKNSDEANIEWIYNTQESDNFLHKPKKTTKSLTPRYNNWPKNNGAKEWGVV